MCSQNLQRTLAIIKPDAVTKKLSGIIIDMIEQAGLSIIGLKILRLTSQKAGSFYEIHKGKPFYDTLVEFMSSGKIIVLALEGTDAISRWRTVMGATDPASADEGTIRRRFGSSIDRNACHG
jgi:nucleoside-diphosphate kinase